MSEISTLEALGLRVWPPAQTQQIDGWTLCLSEGTTRRTNSVQTSVAPLGELDLAARIAACEAAYHRRGLSPVFKLTDASQPAGLDAALGSRGYVAADVTSVQVAPLSGRRFEIDPTVEHSELLDDDWFEACLRLNDVPTERDSGLRAVLDRVPSPRVLATVGRGDATIAQAVAVFADSRLFLCQVATDSARRRSGYGRRLVETLLQWGVVRGATHAWLQVVAANEPANRLYAGLGFSESYRYWYRQPGPG